MTRRLSQPRPETPARRSGAPIAVSIPPALREPDLELDDEVDDWGDPDEDDWKAGFDEWREYMDRQRERS